MASPELDYKSALCFVPPRPFWDHPIQEIRCFNDKAFVRWPPHINLLYPFWKDTGENFQNAAERIRQCLAEFPPFSISFSQFRFFNHGNSCTVWLEPESEMLGALQAALVKAFPECHHLNRDSSDGTKSFIPHLSVGQWPTQQWAEEAIATLSRQFKPITVPVDYLTILRRRDVQTPFEFRYQIPVGSPDHKDIKEINIGYVATLGSSEEVCREYPYGLGSYDQGVWNFAYGANINHTKLVSVRKMTPLESLPGLLEGYKLSFNHHGGMGNVEWMTTAAASYFEARGIYGVHGILHCLTLKDFARLTNMESGYRPVEVEVLASGGRGKIRAVVFISPTHRNVRSDLPTTNRYLNLIIDGAKQWNLDAAYVRWLESLESIPSQNRGPLYWKTPQGRRIPDRIMRVGGDPPSRKPPRRYD